MKIGNREFDLENNCYIMGILNVTPDSFSDGGKYNEMDKALHHVEEMIEQGMDILDIGGESTRPGYTLLSDEEEIERVTPVIEKVKTEFNIPISLDTYKSRVAKVGLQAGADLINDIWGLKYDENMAGVIADFQVPCCLMHNRKEADYRNYMEDVLEDLRETLKIADRAGIAKDNIILDPGVGFGKTYEQNVEIIAKVDRLKELGCPVLLGTSRKSVIGLTLNLPSDQRVEGTLTTSAVGVLKGCSIFRVHDVKENSRAVKMAMKIKEYLL